MEPDCLWCQVITAKYSGLNPIGESPWWRDVKASSCDANGDWFELGVQKFIREGNVTKFWHDYWVDSGVCLAAKYPRLYNLSKLKHAMVQACGVWVGGVWQWDLGWRRGLLGRELGWLHAMLEDINRCHLVEGVHDVWRWLPSQDGVFSVNSFYLFLQVPEGFSADPIFDLIWHSYVPSNVKAFSWRLVLGRIPSKDNLRKRGILHAEEELICSFCTREIETASHLLFTCSVATQVWDLCYAWLGVSTVLPRDSRAHLLQFSFGWNRVQQRVAYSIWLSVVWSLWLWRNEVVFRSREMDVYSIFELVKWRTWSWVKSKLRGFDNSFFEWTSQPLMCLQSV